MSLWAIVPVKALNESKSRLREVLTPEQRVELSREMLLNTLRVLTEVPEIERTLVVSADSKVLTLAQEQGAESLEERGSPSLNKALTQATALARDMYAEAVLVLPADLPLIQANDVRALIEASLPRPIVSEGDARALFDPAQSSPIVVEGDERTYVDRAQTPPIVVASDVQDRAQNPPIIVISPDRRRSGTNALLMAPLGAIKYGFGPDSFERHIRSAEASGARTEIIELPSLGLDLDAPEDLEIYQDHIALIKE
ncbi:MAG: NTP transferase domain-containing protein [Anaerolineales bacterium]